MAPHVALFRLAKALEAALVDHASGAPVDELRRRVDLAVQQLHFDHVPAVHRLHDAARQLVEACDALGENDCTTELMSREAKAREAVRALLSPEAPAPSEAPSEPRPTYAAPAGGDW